MRSQITISFDSMLRTIITILQETVLFIFFISVRITYTGEDRDGGNKTHIVKGRNLALGFHFYLCTVFQQCSNSAHRPSLPFETSHL